MNGTKSPIWTASKDFSEAVWSLQRSTYDDRLGQFLSKWKHHDAPVAFWYFSPFLFSSVPKTSFSCDVISSYFSSAEAIQRAQLTHPIPEMTTIQRAAIRTMTRPMSTSPPPTSERVAKRLKLDRLNADSFKNGVFLAPMVRSGARESHSPSCCTTKTEHV